MHTESKMHIKRLDANTLTPITLSSVDKIRTNLNYLDPKCPCTKNLSQCVSLVLKISFKSFNFQFFNPIHLWQ